MSVLIGCSGWSYDNWVGKFYPTILARKKEEWLRYYSDFFNTVEIGSSYNRPPTELVVSGWVKKSIPLKEFELSIKVPKQIIDEAVTNDLEKARRSAIDFEKVCLQPISKNDILGTALIQLPHSFDLGSVGTKGLADTLDLFDTGKYRYAVELTSSSWYIDDQNLLQEAAQILQERNVAATMFDSPSGIYRPKLSADHAYISMHGRSDVSQNDDICDPDRQSYKYSKEEIEMWSESIGSISSINNGVRVYFGNCGGANAPKNALQLMDDMSIEHREKEIDAHVVHIPRIL